MQWLLEKGLEPEMFTRRPEPNCLRDFSLLEEPFNFKDIRPYDDCNPWFPLEQVWSLLPNCLGDYRYLKGIINNCVGYLDQMEENPIDSEILFEFVESDIHLAALKLLKQVVENRERYTANKLGPIEPEEVISDLNSYNLNEDYK